MPAAANFTDDFVQPRSHTTDRDFKELHQSLAKEKRCWAFRGPGAEPRVDWWLLLESASGGEWLVVQGESKSHRDKVEKGRAHVQTECGKRFKRTGIKSLFVYVTDAQLADSVPKRGILVIAASNHSSYYSFVAGLRREAIFRACSAAVHNSNPRVSP